MLSWANLLNPTPGDTSIQTTSQTARTQSLGSSPLSRESSPLQSVVSTSYKVAVNRQTTVDVLYEYKTQTHLEYPETMDSGRVGHLFTGLDVKQWVNPSAYFAYSLGVPKGSRKHGTCDVLLDDKGVRVPCRVSYATCM